MVYVSYDYYVGTYYGQTPESDFNRLSVRASSYLDYITLGKAVKNADLDAVKMACCALIDAYSGVEKAQEAASKSLDAMQGSELQSQTVGSWSRTYRSGADTASGALSTAAEIEKGLDLVASRYLLTTGLLYRGRGCACGDDVSPCCDRL